MGNVSRTFVLYWFTIKHVCNENFDAAQSRLFVEYMKYTAESQVCIKKMIYWLNEKIAEN